MSPKPLKDLKKEELAQKEDIIKEIISSHKQQYKSKVIHALEASEKQASQTPAYKQHNDDPQTDR